MGGTRERVRAYVDTSVFGGLHDPEFAVESAEFFRLAREGAFVVVVSPLVTEELEGAPEQVRESYYDLLEFVDLVEVDEAALRLHAAYLKARIVGRRWEADALHVAVATVSGCPLLISWNFKHIVNFRRIPLYNGVNLSWGYSPIAIHSPQEVIHDD